MSHQDATERRAYQREFYKSAKQRKRRVRNQQAYRQRLYDRIFTRDGNRCYHCGRIFERKNLQIDHLVASTLGGKNTDENRVTSCIWCNKSKGGKPICHHCKTWKKPERVDADSIRCIQCGAINSFPPGTPASDPDEEPDFIHEIESETESDHDEGQLGE